MRKKYSLKILIKSIFHHFLQHLFTIPQFTLSHFPLPLVHFHISVGYFRGCVSWGCWPNTPGWSPLGVIISDLWTKWRERKKRCVKTRKFHFPHSRTIFVLFFIHQLQHIFFFFNAGTLLSNQQGWWNRYQGCTYWSNIKMVWERAKKLKYEQK